MPAGQPSLWPSKPSRGAWQELRMPSRLLQELHVLCGRQNVTLFMTLLATWATLLHRYSGEEDILISTHVANRNRPEVEGLIGCFASFGSLLRHDLGGDPPFTELLKRVRKTALDAFSHSELPVEVLRDELYVDCDIRFRLHNIAHSGLGLDGLQVERVETKRGRRARFLRLAMTQGDEGLTARLDYNSNIFEAATIQRMLGDLQSLLEGIVADPGQPISRLPLRTESERSVHPARASIWRIRSRKRLHWGLRQARKRAGSIVRAGQAWPLVGGLFARIEEVSGSLLPPMVTEPFRVPSAVLKGSLNQTRADPPRGK
jgi:non-ribosomal peptide synthetase component F